MFFLLLFLSVPAFAQDNIPTGPCKEWIEKQVKEKIEGNPRTGTVSYLESEKMYLAKISEAGSHYSETYALKNMGEHCVAYYLLKAGLGVTEDSTQTNVPFEDKTTIDQCRQLKDFSNQKTEQYSVIEKTEEKISKLIDQSKAKELEEVKTTAEAKVKELEDRIAEIDEGFLAWDCIDLENWTTDPSWFDFPKK